MVPWQRLALGVMSGDMTVPALSNADDMVLKAPSGDELQDLITRCEAYAREYDIMHTTIKTEYTVVPPKKFKVQYVWTALLNNELLQFVDSFIYLWNVLSNHSYYHHCLFFII